ncbi:hypothetical protein LI328DRAFT_131269 [Trichoderma asperelloides]|nr:hypothetical protein LI328DRAFT_131269 [Trichoderma asperelloides]
MIRMNFSHELLPCSLSWRAGSSWHLAAGELDRECCLSRYLRWWADATTHRTRSSGWEDHSWSVCVLVPSWHAISDRGA